MSISGCRVKGSCPSARRLRGFTLIELMVTLAVLAILAALAAPSFSNLINSNRLIGAANDVVAGLQLARLEAVRRGQSVVVCPSTDGSSCAGSDWSRMIVFSDRNGNRQVDAPADVVIRDIVLAGSGLVIKASPNVTAQNWIRFSPDGFAWVGNQRQGGLGVCSSKLPPERNTRDVHVAVSRVSVSERAGTSDCAAPANSAS